MFRLINYAEDCNKNQTHFHIRDSINATDIATALILLKNQHRLSTKCIDDIIKLLKNLHVPNTPSSWYNVKRLIIETKPQSTKYFICSICDNLITNEGYCQFCSTTHHNKLPSFLSFSVANQLENILAYNDQIDLLHQNKDLLIHDIVDAAVYQRIRAKNADRMLTLTMNIDGITPSSGRQSTVWPIVLVVNEIPLKLRFALENIILAGFWPGPSKPTRDQMSHLLRPLVNELLILENGQAFCLFDKTIQMIHVYLIGSCCDKPATALVQCLVEPHTAFGCNRCELEGHQFFIDIAYLHISISIGFMLRTHRGGNVRSFSMSQDDIDNTPARSNERYDILINMFQLQQQFRNLWPKKKQLMNDLANEKNEKGVAGVCILRELAFFDVGRSFMADSLHNIYIGLFVRKKYKLLTYLYFLLIVL